MRPRQKVRPYGDRARLADRGWQVADAQRDFADRDKQGVTVATAQRLEPGWHVGPEFQDRFTTWDSLRKHVRRAGVPARHRERVLRQLVMQDFALRVAAGMGSSAPVVVGTGAVPMREQDEWPREVKVKSGKLPKSSVGGRPLGDIDVFFPGIPDGEEYGARGTQAIRGAVVGTGLGGLMDYAVIELKSDPDGHTVANIRATPRNSVGVEPMEFEIDLKSPRSLEFIPEGDGFEAAAHPYVPVSFPGFTQPAFKVPRAEYQLADMLVLANEPRADSELDGEWPRGKDLYTLYQMIKTGRFDGDLLLEAVQKNPNWKTGGPPPELTTYDIYARSELTDPVVATKWRTGVDTYKQEHPDLRAFPTTQEMQRTVVAFVRGLARAGKGAQWHDGAWHRADGSKVSPVWTPPAVSSQAARRAETAGPSGKPYDKAHDESRSKAGVRAKPTAPLNRVTARMHAAKRSWQYARTMHQAAKLWSVSAPVVLSYGSARSEVGSREYEQAREFNRLMAQHGWAGRTGAGPGVMEGANRGMREGGGISQGIGLTNLPREQKPNQYIDQLVLAHGFPERMEALRTGARAYVAFEGGVGTAQEIIDILGLMNTGKIEQAPVVFVGTEFWESQRHQLEKMVATGKLNKDIFDNVLFTDSVTEAADFVIRTDAKLQKQRRIDADIAAGVESATERGSSTESAKTSRTTLPPSNLSAVISNRRTERAARGRDKVK